MSQRTTSRFVAEQWLPFPVERVFFFFLDPRNLPPLMPAWQDARIESMQLIPPTLPAGDYPPGILLAGEGSKITLSFRPFPFSPVRLRWEAVILDFAWNSHFSDLQVRGPFARWTHRHSIRAEQRSGRQGTLLRDEVIYAAPFGALGSVADRMFVPTQLRNTFAYRHRKALELLQSSED